MDTSGRLIVSFHITKCAGQWLAKSIQDTYPPGTSTFLYQTRSNPSYESLGFLRAYFYFLPEPLRRTLRIIHGHGAFWGIHEYFPDRKTEYSVMLREPVTRTISHYYYFRKSPGARDSRKSLFDKHGNLRTLSDWIIHTPSAQNHMVRFLYARLFHREIEGNVTEREYRETLLRLRSFAFVGHIDRPGDKEKLLSFLDIQKPARPVNRSVRYAKPTQADIKHIQQMNEFDTRLYAET